MTYYAPETIARINEHYSMRWYFGSHGQDYPNFFSTAVEYDEAGRAAYDLQPGDMLFVEGQGGGDVPIEVAPEERERCGIAAIEDLVLRTNTFRYAIHIALARGAGVRYADATSEELKFVNSIIKDQSDQIPDREHPEHWARWLLFRHMMREESAYMQMLGYANEHLSQAYNPASRPQINKLWGGEHLDRMRARAAADGLNVEIIELKVSSEAERNKEREAYIGMLSTHKAS